MISFHIFEDIPYITKEHTSQCGGLRSVIDNKVEDTVTHMFNHQMWIDIFVIIHCHENTHIHFHDNLQLSCKVMLFHTQDAYDDKTPLYSTVLY